jgi:DNA-binding NarL/FixJ family response regulator
MTPEQAAAYALSVVTSTPTASALASRPTYPADLTAREVEVLRLVAQGLTTGGVAPAGWPGSST